MICVRTGNGRVQLGVITDGLLEYGKNILKLIDDCHSEQIKNY